MLFLFVEKRRYFTYTRMERKFLIDTRDFQRERVLLTRRDMETNYFVRERQPTEVNNRLLLVHVKRFVPQNIEFVVYRRTTHPRVSRVLIFVYRLSTGRYISENLPISGRPGISAIPFTIGRTATDVFQIKVSLIFLPIASDP